MRSSIFAALLLACAPHREEAPAATATAEPPIVVVPPEPVTIEVFAEWPGQGVLEVERALALPLEQALREVAGVKRIHSDAREGLATIVLTLDPRADRSLGRAAVFDRLTMARRSLPSDVLTSIGPDLAGPASALVFALTSTSADSMQLHRMAGALREALVTIPDVGAVEVCGGREPRLVVALDAGRLSALRLPIPAVVQALTSSLSDDPGAHAGLFVTATRSMAELLTVRVRPGEPAVTLGDVASITVEPAITDCDAARIGGGLVIVGQVRARRGADRAVMTAAVQAELAARRAELAAQGATLEVFTAPLRFMLDLPARTDPGEATIAASRSIADELTASGPGYAARTACLQVTRASRSASDLDGELILESTGLGDADIAALEQRLSSAAAVRGRLSSPSSLRFWITGDELAANRRIAEQAAELVTGMSGVVYARAHDPLSATQVLAIRRERLAELGLSTAELGVTLAAAVDGAAAGRVQLDGARLPVIVRVGPTTRASASMAALGQLEVLLPAGGAARLTELVDLKTELEPAKISRVDGRRATRVDVTVRVGESMPTRLAALQRELAASLELPVGHTLVWD